MRINRPLVLYIMGVSGSGKSTIGTLLAQELSIPFFDGDDFHPKENIKKMAQGIPLTDTDRMEWLQKLNTLAREQLAKGSCIIACSALTKNYRTILMNGIEKDTKWVFLEGTREQIEERIKNRKDHFMPAALLQSQFETLERPVDALTLDISLQPNELVQKIKTEIDEKSEFGIIGLGVMGKSLSRNLARHGFNISIYNRHVPNLEENVAFNFKKEFDELEYALPFDDLQDFVNSLQSPRKILIMVNAGEAVDFVLNDILPLLSANDVIIDGGNSHFKDTQRRIEQLPKYAIQFLGCGISGGEEGALYGPSLMPGGSEIAYTKVKPFLESIVAKDKNKTPCCTYIGDNGSGHYVKMVHNGIEYAEMQLLAEVYSILKATGRNPDEISDILQNWKNESDSYLLEITIEILKFKEGNDWLINKILDQAKNKGTGNWTTVEMTQLGMPGTMISTALFARYLSSFKEERMEMESLYGKNTGRLDVNIDRLHDAYKLTRIINHHQGFRLLKEASVHYLWDLNLSEIARIWTNGCIIRSALMEKISSLLSVSEHILFHPEIVKEVALLKPFLKEVTTACISADIPIPCFNEALNFLNGYSISNSSANIIQAQRDYFGAHTYQRIDKPKEQNFHTNWKAK